MPSLYDLSAAYAALCAQYDAAQDDEERALILDSLSGVNEDIGDKAENYARLVRNLDAEEAIYDAEIKRLTAKRDAARNFKKRLKETLMKVMTDCNAPKLVTSIGAWRIQETDYSVDVTDEAQIPAQYRVAQPDKIDKMAIKRAFKLTGEIIPGCEIAKGQTIVFR